MKDTRISEDMEAADQSETTHDASDSRINIEGKTSGEINITFVVEPSGKSSVFKEPSHDVDFKALEKKLQKEDTSMIGLMEYVEYFPFGVEYEVSIPVMNCFKAPSF